MTSGEVIHISHNAPSTKIQPPDIIYDDISRMILSKVWYCNMSLYDKLYNDQMDIVLFHMNDLIQYQDKSTETNHV